MQRFGKHNLAHDFFSSLLIPKKTVELSKMAQEAAEPTIFKNIIDFGKLCLFFCGAISLAWAKPEHEIFEFALLLSMCLAAAIETVLSTKCGMLFRDKTFSRTDTTRVMVASTFAISAMATMPTTFVPLLGIFCITIFTWRTIFLARMSQTRHGMHDQRLFWSDCCERKRTKTLLAKETLSLRETAKKNLAKNERPKRGRQTL